MTPTINEKLDQWTGIIQKIQGLLEPIGSFNCDISLSFYAACAPDLTLFVSGNAPFAKRIAQSLPGLEWKRISRSHGFDYEAKWKPDPDSPAVIKICLFKAEPLPDETSTPLDLDEVKP